MMLTEHKIWRLPLILLLAVWLGGCSMQYSEDELRAMRGEEDGMSLILNISTGDVSGFGTRAVEDPDRFEQAVLPTEKIQSLRIIIVDIQQGSKTYNRVIHNYSTGDLSYARFNISGIRFDNLAFSNTYRIYLIANEKGLPDTQRAKFSETALYTGSQYPADGEEDNLLENIILYSRNIGSGKFLIDNENSSSVAIPITEIFELTTDPRPDSNEEDLKYYMKRNFFITRAASKFSFKFYNGENISDKNLEMKNIKISGLGTEEYLFPKNTVYFSHSENKEYHTDEDSSSIKPEEGMEITSFDIPYPSSTGEYIFSFSKKISSIGPEGFDFNPRIYFPESKGNSGNDKFQCSISFDGETFTSPITLPNLDALPRNTHVLINVTFHEIGFEISVEPWIVGGRTEIKM